MKDLFPLRLCEYLALQKSRPTDFEGPADGTRIVLDPAHIERIEADVGAAYRERGFPSHWAEIGIAYEDPYFKLLRDAVIFPGGAEGIHHRVLYRSSLTGVAVLPLQGQSVVLIRHFRHPTRQWHWEIPRGAIEASHTIEETAFRELEEEVGARIIALTPIGRIHGSTGLLNGAVALVIATIAGIGHPALNEGIAEIRLVDTATLEAMVLNDEITDAFTLAAILQARLRGLL